MGFRYDVISLTEVTFEVLKMQLKHIPNVITCLRILIVIPVLWALCNEHYVLAFFLFVIAAASDALDGLLARLFGWTSQLGAFIDPIADKFLLMGSFIALTWLGHIPLWLTALVVARDIWIMSGALAYRCLIGPLEFKPLFISKSNTVFQLLLVTLLLLKLSFLVIPEWLLQIVIGLVFVTTVITFIQYTWVWGWRACRNYIPHAKRNLTQKV